jgi:hypothetical protein
MVLRGLVIWCRKRGLIHGEKVKSDVEYSRFDFEVVLSSVELSTTLLLLGMVRMTLSNIYIHR